MKPSPPWPNFLLRAPSPGLPGRLHPAHTHAGLPLRLAALPLLLFFTLPILMLMAQSSPQQLLASLRQEQVQQAVQVTLKTTSLSLLLIILAGAPLAYLMGRHQFPFKRLLDTLIDLPTVLPPSVAGLALLMAFGRRGLLGSNLEALGFSIAFTQAAVVLAQVFIAAPFFVRSAALGFASVDVEIEQAAQLDGASRWQIFRHIILPLSRPALLSGSMLSWARAVGEFGATILFAGNFPGRTQTMATAIYLGFEVDINIAITLSILLILTSFGAILLVKSLFSRGAE